MEHFINNFVEAIINHRVREFENKYEEIPVLILDGMEAIAGKAQTQDEIYKCIRKRFYEDKSTLIIAPKTLDNYGFDNRIITLISGWKSVSV